MTKRSLGRKCEWGTNTWQKYQQTKFIQSTCWLTLYPSDNDSDWKYLQMTNLDQMRVEQCKKKRNCRGLTLSPYFLQHFFLLLKRSIVGKMAKPFPNKAWILRVCSLSLSKTRWESRNPLRERPFCHFDQINCCLQTPSFGKSPKFVVWESVKGKSLSVH